MYSRILFFSVLFLMFSCSKNDDSSDDDGQDPQELKYLKAFSNESGSRTDTLLYDENRLVLRKEYIEDFLDYNHNFVYNTNNQLVKLNRMHSTATIPSEETIYTYYADGNLKTRKHTRYNQASVDQIFTYSQNLIKINEGTTSEVRIHLNQDGRIVSAEKFFEPINSFFNIKSYEYDENGNVKKVSERYDPNTPYINASFIFDNNINPDFVFDYKLPNGLSIKQLEAVFSHSNYYSVSLGDDDNLISYFNKNNFTSVTNDVNNFEYNYDYDEKKYPIKIYLPFGDNYITLTY